MLAKYNIELKAEYIPSKKNRLAELCSRAFSSNVLFKKFNNHVENGTFILEYIYYDKLYFEHNL